MQDGILEKVYADLLSWCRQRDFAGQDPFDGLNSRLFQASPFRNSRTARLLWTQFFKRSPIDFRSTAQVPQQRNAKGIALFALASLARLRTKPTEEGDKETRKLLTDLISMRLTGFNGAAWGYNFDWQGRAFYAPRGTPTVVPTAFAARALIEAAELLDGHEHSTDYLSFARTICDFILNDLNRTEDAADEVCFSYSPLDTTRVFNASLLAGEVLAVVGRLAKESSLCEWAKRTARYVVRRQRADGSWSYGGDDYQSWADNFHTAFILTSLSRIIRSCESAPDEFESALRRGYEYWHEQFFLANGWPKYFPGGAYPADVHAAGAALVALAELRGQIPGTLLLADKIAHWTTENLYNRSGYFYYQRRRFYTIRIPYMRWSEAWMAYGLARLIEAKHSS